MEPKCCRPSVTVTGVSLSTAVRSVEVIILYVFVTNVGITSSIRDVTTTANASLTLTGTSASFGLNSPTVQLVKEVNATGVSLVTALEAQQLQVVQKLFHLKSLEHLVLELHLLKQVLKLMLRYQVSLIQQ